MMQSDPYLVPPELLPEDFVNFEGPYPEVPDAASEEEAEELRKEIAERGRRDLYFLCSFILGYKNLRESTHGHLCRFIETCNVNRRMLHMPRSHYKTTIFTIGETIRDIIRDPEIRILVVAGTELNASRFVTEIKNHFKMNERFRWLYKEIIPQDFSKVRWSATEMEVKRTSTWREPTVDAIGAGGSVESRHYDVIRGDDIMNRKHFESQTELEKLKDWSDGLEALLITPEHQLDIIGSRWRRDDIYHHLEWFYSGDLPAEEVGPFAVMKGDIAIFSRRDMETDPDTGEEVPIFPYDEEVRSGVRKSYLVRLRERNPEWYAAQYANNPIVAGLNVFEEGWLQSAMLQTGSDGKRYVVCLREGQEVHRVSLRSLRIIALFDPAIAENKKTSARQAMLVVGVEDLGRSGKYIYLLESRIGFYTPTDAIEYILEIDKEWRPEIFSIESVGYQGSIKYWLDDHCSMKMLPYPPIVEWPPKGVQKAMKAKTERVKGLQPYFRYGYVWWVGEHPELKEEYIFWRPKSDSLRDGLDALAQLPEYIGGIWDEEAEQERERQQDRVMSVLDQTGYGLLGRREREEWDEEAFLNGFDSSGYNNTYTH